MVVLFPSGYSLVESQPNDHDADIIRAKLLKGVVQQEPTGLGRVCHVFNQLDRLLITANIPKLWMD